MKITLQDQLINLLTNYVQAQPANKKLASERQLADKYQVSRTTIRSVLMDLEANGIVRRIRGKGTFVNRVNLESDLGCSYKFNQQMTMLGKIPSTEIISFEHKEVNSFFAQKLHLKLGQLIYKIERLRLADGEPMMLERTYLPVDIFPTLTRDMLEGSSMYDIFHSQFSEDVHYADEYFSAGLISSCDSQYMELKEGSPCLQIQRRTYDNQNNIIEFTISVARSDEFAYHVRHNIMD